MTKLLLDEMLGRTAKWLRIFGIDTAYIKPKTDQELIDYTIADARILVTRDEDLANRCKKQGVQSLLLKSQNIDAQLIEIKNRLGLELPFPDNTRCPECNGELQIVDKEKVRNLVIENVLNTRDKFWLCKKCNKAYWEGSHWKNIATKYNKVCG